MPILQRVLYSTASLHAFDFYGAHVRTYVRPPRKYTRTEWPILMFKKIYTGWWKENWNWVAKRNGWKRWNETRVENEMQRISLSLSLFFFLSFFSVSLTLSRSFFHSWMLLRVKERWREDCSVSIPFSRVRCKSNNCVTTWKRTRMDWNYCYYCY